MKQPKITVLITTYNRSELLKHAIQSVLNQTLKHIEIIILDDASPDDTKDVVASYIDKRITYIRQKNNVGFTQNFIAGIKNATGEYVFLLSDDDMILRSNSLEVLYKEMKIKNAGVGTMSLLFYENDMSKPTYLFSARKGVYYLPPSPDNILKVIHWHFGFMSGNMYQRRLIRMSDIEDDLWMAHLKPLYRALISHGCIYLGSHYILGQISTHGNIKHLDVHINNGYHLPKQIKMYQDLDGNSKRQKTYIKMAVTGVSRSLIGVKYYSSTSNMLVIASELRKLYPSINFSLIYWLNLIGALILPKSILSLIRTVRLVLQSNQLVSTIASIGIEKYLTLILKPSQYK
ncbi:MAG: glycosyltransferase family 2 protein [bacterium]|nr:glycosyltransferase family 2 protein [bacterium]